MDYEGLSTTELIEDLNGLSNGKKWWPPFREFLSRFYTQSAEVHRLRTENKELKTTLDELQAEALTEYNRYKAEAMKVKSQAQTIKYLVAVADLLTTEVQLDS
jgi:cell shape-determining protein MreC